jgi:hypothetical protein
VSIPIDLCNSAKGALYVRPTGEAMISAENSFSDAQCFTSLDGVSFVQCVLWKPPAVRRWDAPSGEIRAGWRMFLTAAGICNFGTRR